MYEASFEDAIMQMPDEYILDLFSVLLNEFERRSKKTGNMYEDSIYLNHVLLFKRKT